MTTVAERIRDLIREDRLLPAVELARDRLVLDPRDLVVRQQLGLALARAGATAHALEVLEGLCDEGHEDAETLGLLARVYKDRFVRSGVSNGDDLARAVTLYQRAHREDPAGYWAGVNLATLHRVSGNDDLACALAEEIEARCLTKLDAPEDAFWLHATLGECGLVRGDLEGAASWYRKAMTHGADRVSDVVSARRNAALLERVAPGASDVASSCLPVPSVLVFAGHMVDRPGRADPRFPAHTADAVKADIGRRLDAIGPAVVYASAACGADILCLEAAAERGCETHVVLPYARSHFRADSVDVVEDGSWGGRFDAVLARATRVRTVAPERTEWSGVAYEHANRMLLGLAKSRARRLDTLVRGLCFWNRRPGDGTGGTSWAVGLWQAAGVPVEVIEPTGSAGPDRPEAPSDPGTAASAAGAEADVKAILFADLRGFSGLSERQIPAFVERVLGQVADVVRECPSAPLLCNTWGDGIHMVFPTARDAGCFALALLERTRGMAELLAAAPPDLEFRIGLHAGPVYALTDPLTERPTFAGSHVSHTARIEPVAPPGHAFASEWFAALAEVEAVSEFACDYAGETDLPKEHGRYPLYRLRRSTTPRGG